jgi:hypothetical protein
MDRSKYQQSLDLADLQFRLSLHISAKGPGISSLTTHFKGMTYGKYALGEDELQLSPQEAATASRGLEHCATLILAIAVDTALENCFGKDRFKSQDSQVSTASYIGRILRNAFAHDPFFPRWKLQNPCYRCAFEIRGVISLDTTSLDDRAVEWEDYGGPLALLRFLRYCRDLISDDDLRSAALGNAVQS